MASNRFVVDLGDLKVADEVSNRLNARIQKAVLEELATIDVGGDYVVRFPREWWGIILREFAPNIRDQFNDVEKRIGGFMRQ